MNILIVLLSLSGMFFLTVATIGLLRLPDIFSRLHASAKCDTLGAGLSLLAAGLYVGWHIDTIKILIIIIFIWITSPTAAYLIGRHAFRSGEGFPEGTKVIDFGIKGDQD